MGPEKKIFSSHNKLNTKPIEQRKNMKRSKGKGPSNIKMYTYQNYTRLLNRDYKSQKNLVRAHADSRGTQMPPQATVPAKLSINIDGETKVFQDKTKFKQYLSTNPVLQRMLEGKLQQKEGHYTIEN